MFHQRALRQCLRVLRARHIELGLCTRHIQARRDAAIVPLFGQIQCTAIGLHRVVENRAIAVETAQLDIVVDKLGNEAEACVFQIRRCRCGLCVAGSDLIADAAPQIQFVGGRRADRIRVVVRGRRRDRATQRLGIRLTVAFDVSVAGYCGKQP